MLVLVLLGSSVKGVLNLLDQRVSGCLTRGHWLTSLPSSENLLPLQSIIGEFNSPDQEELVRLLCSLIPRPPLAAFFAAVEKRVYFHGYKKNCEGRPGYEASCCVPPQKQMFQTCCICQRDSISTITL